MGTGFSIDPNEYHAAANVIEGYGSMQADHGATLAAGTSTPLSSSGTGISGAISQIAMGTVQKIVTDVTSTTQGFANDTAKGLRAQANTVSQLETDLASHAKSILSGAGAQPSPFVASYPMSGGSTATSSPLTSYGSSGMSAALSSPLTARAPLNGSSLGELGSNASRLSESTAGAAGALGQEASQESSMLASEGMGMMRGGGGSAAGAGAAEERGQRPDYLKSKTELTDADGDRVKATADKHLQECGTAPIPLDASRLVCAKCGSILTIDDAQTLSTA